MQTLTQFIFVLSAVVGAGALALAAAELRSIGTFLRTGTLHVWLDLPSPSSRLPASIFDSQAGYALFAFRNGKWQLEGDFSKPGYEAVAPAIPGTWEGQIVKKESGLKAKG